MVSKSVYGQIQYLMLGIVLGSLFGFVGSFLVTTFFRFTDKIFGEPTVLDEGIHFAAACFAFFGLLIVFYFIVRDLDKKSKLQNIEKREGKTEQFSRNEDIIKRYADDPCPIDLNGWIQIFMYMKNQAITHYYSVAQDIFTRFIIVLTTASIIFMTLSISINSKIWINEIFIIPLLIMGAIVIIVVILVIYYSLRIMQEKKNVSKLIVKLEGGIGAITYGIVKDTKEIRKIYHEIMKDFIKSRGEKEDIDLNTFKN